MPRRIPLLLALLILAAPAFAQPNDLTDRAKDLLAKFKAERATAEKTFTKEELTAADEQAAKAEQALANGNAAAARLVTEARWQLPILPNDLPPNVTRVLGAGRLRHGDRVNSLCYSPDGTKLASGSRDGTVRVWDVGNGRELLVYRGHEAAKVVEADEKAKREEANVFRVPGVAFDRTGKRVASCGANEVQVWEADTGKPITTLKGHKKDVKAIAFAHKNPDLLASVGDDKALVLWDLKTGKPTFQTTEEKAAKYEDVAFSPTDNQVAAVDSAGMMTVFTLGGAKPKLGYGGQVSDKNGLHAVAFAPDGVTVFAGGMDKKIKLVSGPSGPEAQNGNTLRTYTGHDGSVRGLAVAPDGKQLISVGEKDRTVLVWDIESGKQLRAFPGDAALKEGVCVAVRPDGRQIAAGFENGVIRLIPFSAADDHRAVSEAKDNLWSVAYSPDGKAFATAGADRTVRVYDADTGKLKKELTGHKLAVTAVVFLNNGTLASAAGDKTVKVWDIAAGTAKDCTGHGLAVLAVAADPAGKVLVSGGADKTVRGWNPADGQAKWKWEGRSAVCGLAVSGDGKQVAVGSADGKLTILDVSGETPSFKGDVGAHSAGVSCVAFNPSGDKLATCGGDGLVRTWAAAVGASPTPLTKFDPPFKQAAGAAVLPVTSVAFSPDGKLLVGGGAEGVVRVWDVTAGAEFRGLRGHAGWVTAVAFSPDGSTVLSCGIDKTARAFELPRADAAVTGHRGSVDCIAVSRDGRYAATGSADRTVKVWDLATGREVATLVGGDEGGDGVTAVVFVGKDHVAAFRTGEKEKKLRTWTFRPNKLVSEKAITQVAIFLAASEDGKTVGAAWTDGNTTGKSDSGFDLFTADPNKSVTKETSKGVEDATNAAALSPDAKWGVLAGKNGVIRIWDVAKKERLGGDWPLFKTVIADLGLTPDRKLVVAIDENGEVKVADTDKREVTATVKAVSAEVRGVIVSPTGDKFATLSGDGEVKAWDMKCKEVRTWKLPQAPKCAVFTTDGKRLITGNQDGTALVLELP